MRLEPNFKWDSEQKEEYVQISINQFKRISGVGLWRVNWQDVVIECNEILCPTIQLGKPSTWFELKMQRLWPKFGWRKRRKDFEKTLNVKVIERRVNGVNK
jgi:hypothetical protein